MNLIVSATSSYNLSSMAVEPMSSSPTSIFSSSAATISSRFFVANLAFWAPLNHAENVSSSMTLSARKSVLKPSAAYESTWRYVSDKTGLFFERVDNLSKMTLSAPLQSNLISPVYSSLTITLIRFLVEVNSQTCSNLYFRIALRTSSKIIMQSLLSIPLKMKPNSFAALTRASSSGDAALNVPFFSSMMMVWQMAKKRITLLSAVYCSTLPSWPSRTLRRLGS